MYSPILYLVISMYMRTLEQIETIKKHHKDPVQMFNALSKAKIDALLSHYNQSNKVEKNTGPKVVYVEEGQGIIDDILQVLRKNFGDFKVRSAHYFEVDKPHVLHIDDDFSYPNTYMAFTIPLWVESGNCDKIKLIMFDQYYYGGPVKFYKGEETIEQVYYNKPLYDYKDVDNLSDKGIPMLVKEKLLTHLKSEWLEGLSIKNYFPWNIGSIICFDSLRIHCSSDFRKVGINKKIGLSIFTEL